jgi:hypothetical protein
VFLKRGIGDVAYYYVDIITFVETPKAFAYFL